MKNKSHSKLHFFIDTRLLATAHGELIVQALKELELEREENLSDDKLNIIFTDTTGVKNFSKIKHKLFIHSCVNLDEISLILKNILIADWWSSLNFKLKESEQILNAIKQKDLSAKKNVVESLSREIELILDLELQLLKEDDLEKWNMIIKNFGKKNHWSTVVTLFKEKDLMSEENILDTHTLVFQLPIGQYFFAIKDKNILKPEEELRLELLVLVIMKAVQNIDYQESSDGGEIEFWKNIFSKIPYPMSVISELGELLLYNEHFAKIGILPRECLSYKDQDHLEMDKQYYQIRRFGFDFHGSHINYFIFYTSEKSLNNPNNELGIVSSSIAHELNNPLAGILAALSLLQIEEDWSDEAKIEIEEMKNGAKRCKELVEIFLGFSRLSPKDGSGTSLKLSLDQALNLLRFRMVESDLRIDMKLVVDSENINFDVNASVLSMVFYLIMSELMTAFAHHRLLTLQNTSLLEGTVIGKPGQVQFILNEEFEYEKNILHSKLLQHLLFFEKMEIVFFQKEIRLVRSYK